MSSRHEAYQRIRQTELLVSIPMVLAAGPGIGFLIGDYLDRTLGTDPWLMVLFFVLGLAAAVRQTLTILARARLKE